MKKLHMPPCKEPETQKRRKQAERKEEYKAKLEGAPPLRQVPTSLRSKGH